MSNNNKNNMFKTKGSALACAIFCGLFTLAALIPTCLEPDIFGPCLIFAFFFGIFTLVCAVTASQLPTKKELMMQLREQERRRKEQELQRKMQERQLRAEKLYNKCNSNGISVITQENRNEFALVAQNVGYSNIDEAIEDFKTGQAIVEKKQQAELQEKRNADQQITNEYYALMQEMAAPFTKERYLKTARSELRTASAFSEAAATFSKIERSNANHVRHERDSDWGTAGGLASAIGGPAAGLAAAANIQAKNAERAATRSDRIDAHENNASQLRAASANMSSQARGWQAKISRVEEAIADDKNSAENFKKVKINVSKYQVTIGGNMKLDITTSVDEPINILNKEAILDGSFKLYVCQNGKRIGETLVCANGYDELSIKRIGYNATDMKSKQKWHGKDRGYSTEYYYVPISLSAYCKPYAGEKFNDGETYTFEFEDNYTWAIQKW